MKNWKCDVCGTTSLKTNYHLNNEKIECSNCYYKRLMKNVKVIL